MSNDWLSALAESAIALALPMQKLAVLKSASQDTGSAKYHVIVLEAAHLFGRVGPLDAASFA
jgi:hypothetical protein